MADPQSLAKGLMATEPVMRAYEPSWRDRMAAALMGDGRASPARSQVVMGLLGSRGLGSTGLSAIDATPAGAILDMQQAAQHGDRAGMALAAAGMVPGAKVAEGKKLIGSAMPTASKYMINLYHGTFNKYPNAEFDLNKFGTGAYSNITNDYVTPDKYIKAIYATTEQPHAKLYGDQIHNFILDSRKAHKINATKELSDWAKELKYKNAQDLIDNYYNGDIYDAFDADNRFNRIARETYKLGKPYSLVNFGELMHNKNIKAGTVAIITDPKHIIKP